MTMMAYCSGGVALLSCFFLSSMAVLPFALRRDRYFPPLGTASPANAILLASRECDSINQVINRSSGHERVARSETMMVRLMQELLCFSPSSSFCCGSRRLFGGKEAPARLFAGARAST